MTKTIQIAFQTKQFRQWSVRVGMLTLVCLSNILCANDAHAQRPNFNQPGSMSLQHGGMPAGQIGQQRMLVRPEMAGYMQPIQFMLPKGSEIAVWDGKAYQKLNAKKPQVRMMVGAVYRLKITGIPQFEGRELFPSIEIINRLYPPAGEADRFPVMVQIQDDEMKKALNGKYVKRVTYLEDPETAIPFQQVKGDQSYFQIAPGQDVLKVAAGLGRPMTIVRMGSRIPLATQDAKFGLGRAPFQIMGQQQRQQPVKISGQFQNSNATTMNSQVLPLSRAANQQRLPNNYHTQQKSTGGGVQQIPSYSMGSEALSTKQASTFIPTPRTIVNPYYQSSVPSTGRQSGGQSSRVHRPTSSKVRYNPYEEFERLKRLEQQKRNQKK